MYVDCWEVVGYGGVGCIKVLINLGREYVSIDGEESFGLYSFFG